jgi:shikimate dehydrogenase
MGNPVEHSRSPCHPRPLCRTHRPGTWRTNAAWCHSTALALRVRDFASAAGGRGCNITVPFKLEAAQAGQRAQRTRATGGRSQHPELHRRRHPRRQHRRPGPGGRHHEQGAGFALAGRDVLLVGAGGAAAGVPWARCWQAGVRHVVVANRTLERAQALVQSHAAPGSATKNRAARAISASARGMILISSSTPPPAAWPAPTPYPYPRACCAPAAWPTT